MEGARNDANSGRNRRSAGLAKPQRDETSEEDLAIDHGATSSSAVSVGGRSAEEEEKQKRGRARVRDDDGTARQGEDGRPWPVPGPSNNSPSRSISADRRRTETERAQGSEQCSARCQCRLPDSVEMTGGHKRTDAPGPGLDNCSGWQPGTPRSSVDHPTTTVCLSSPASTQYYHSIHERGPQGKVGQGTTGREGGDSHPICPVPSKSQHHPWPRFPCQLGPSPAHPRSPVAGGSREFAATDSKGKIACSRPTRQRPAGTVRPHLVTKKSREAPVIRPCIHSAAAHDGRLPSSEACHCHGDMERGLSMRAQRMVTGLCCCSAAPKRTYGRFMTSCSCTSAGRGHDGGGLCAHTLVSWVLLW